MAIHDKHDEPDADSGCRRATLAATVDCSGLGIHTGRPARLRIEPAPFGKGITFAEWARPADRVPCHVAHTAAPGGATVVCADGWQVSTVEHLLAACSGFGITDARVVVDGVELPALDGSAAGWVALLERAGRVVGPPVSRCRPSTALHVELGNGRARWEPSSSSIAEVRAGERSVRVCLWTAGSPDAFKRDVAWARTFVHREDIARLRGAGRGRGATWANTIFLGGDRAPSLRGADEPLRHKLLDLIGDLSLVGRPWSGHVIVERGSHALHHALVRACVANAE